MHKVLLPFACRLPASDDMFGPDIPSCMLLGLPVMDSSNATPSSPVWPSSCAGLLFSASSAVSSSCLIISSVKDKKQQVGSWLYH